MLDVGLLILRIISRFTTTAAARWNQIMMTSSNGNIFPVAGLLCRKFTGQRSQRPGDLKSICWSTLDTTDMKSLIVWWHYTWWHFDKCVPTCNEHICRVMCICFCPASRTTLVATRFRVAVICPIIQVPHCIRVFFYFVWFVFINHIFQFYNELCTYCNILDIYLS